MVETISSVVEVWKTLSNLYSGEGNVMLVVETQERISYLKQGERSVLEYVAELQRLWADLDYYDPLELTHSECVTTIKKWIEYRRVIEFLKGLHPEFDGRRATMFHQPSLPSLDEAIAAIAQEETRLKVLSSFKAPEPPIRPAFAIVETRECFNCGEKGHFIRNCCAPHKPNRGRGRGSDRGGPRGGGRGHGYRSDHRANVATTIVDNVASLAYSDSHSNWILDSGASRHVTGETKTNREETWDWS